MKIHQNRSPKPTKIIVLGALGGLLGSLVASWWALGAILAHLGPKSQHNIQKVGSQTPLGPPSWSHLGAQVEIMLGQWCSRTRLETHLQHILVPNPILEGKLVLPGAPGTPKL